MKYELKTYSFREFNSNHSFHTYGQHWNFLNHFESRNKLSPATFRRECEEQLEIFLEMRKHDMLVKLEKGEFSFAVVPDEFPTSRSIARKIGVDYFELCNHLQHMEKSGILEFYTQDKIDRKFFHAFSDIETSIPSFPAFSNHHRNAFNEMTTEAAADFIRNLLTNKRIMRVEYVGISPGVSINEYD